MKSHWLLVTVKPDVVNPTIKPLRERSTVNKTVPQIEQTSILRRVFHSRAKSAPNSLVEFGPAKIDVGYDVYIIHDNLSSFLGLCLRFAFWIN